MAEHFDVIIVGARCAGSPLAMLLARAGMRVCVIDRARFPSETPSTHTVQASGVQILDSLGVLDALLKLTPPMEQGTLVFDDVRIDVDRISALLGAPMMNARRATLDAALLEAAVGAGAEVRTQTAIVGLIEQGGRVAGVTTEAAELRAPLVVGADGAQSTVARLVGAEEYSRTEPGRLFLWAYFEGITQGRDRLWLGKIGDNGFLATPTDSELFMAAVVPSMDRKGDLLGNLSAGFAAGLAGWPELDGFLAGAKRVGPVRVMARWHGFFRRSAGPGWALAGDAGHFKDPTPGQGISDALRQTVKLAEAIEGGLGGAVTSDRALSDWWRWRDRDAWEMYWFAHDMGAPGPTPLLRQQLLRRIGADPQLTNGLLGVLNHDLAPSKVFTPSLALTAASEALRRGRGQRRVILREARSLVVDEVRRRRPPSRSAA